MPNYFSELDGLFHALADPTRRAVVERLSRGPGQVKDLASAFLMALPSFTQHLSVLEKCGLIHSEKNGRVRTYHLRPQKLREAQVWARQQRKIWKKHHDQDKA